MPGRRSRVVMTIATCLLSVPLTVWVVSHSPAGRVTLTANGEDVPASVTAPLALAGRPHAPHLDLHAEPAAALPDSTAADDAPPPVEPVARAAALPSSLLTVVTPERPQAEPSRPHDVSPRRERITAELATQTRGYLQRLDRIEDGAGSPMGRVSNFFTFLEQQQCAGGTCQAAQRVTEDYLRARAALLHDMLEAFMESDGVYDGRREHQALQALHAAFKVEMATIAAHVPMLAMLPDILESTLHVPDYLEATEDDTRSLK